MTTKEAARFFAIRLFPAGAPAHPRAALAWLLVLGLAISLPPKWSSLHLAGLLLAAWALARRQRLWFDPAARLYAGLTLLWLAPVLVNAGFQYASHLPSAPAPLALALLSLRIVGVGLGVVCVIRCSALGLRGVTLALLLALSFHAAAGLIEWLVFTSDTAWRAQRLDGLTFNPNPYGTFMAFAAVLAAGLAQQATVARPWLLTLCGLALICVWASGSRAAFLVVVAGCFVLFPPLGPRRAVAWMTGLALAAGAWMVSTHDAGIAASNHERMLALLYSLDLIRESPWLGWGFDAYEHLPGRYGPNAPHNLLLDLWVSSGIIPVIAWIASTVLLAVKLVSHGSPAARLALAALTMASLAGLTEYSLLDSTHFRGMWTIITALACCIVVDRQSAKRTCCPAPSD